MDIKSEVEIKDELLESSEHYINDDQSFEQEVKNENFYSNKDVKEEFDKKDEFFYFNEESAQNDEHIKGNYGLNKSEISISDVGHEDNDVGPENSDMGHKN
ncbi:hypothetical protein Avbf_13323, partial [Armadillidium vulgare]